MTFIMNINASEMIFEVDSSNIGEFSRAWGHILDENLEKFFKYPTIMYIINLCWDIPTFGIAMVLK
jgi:hypothetical protein